MFALTLSLFAAAVAGPPIEPVRVHTNTASIRALSWDGQILWAATGGGLEAWDEDGHAVARIVDELPATELLSVGSHDGEVTVGTAMRGAARWDGARFGMLGDAQEHGEGVVGVLEEQLVTRKGVVLPQGIELDAIAADAVDFGGATVVGLTMGQLAIVRGQRVQRIETGCPVVDLAVGPEGVRVACLFSARIWDGVTLHELDLPATAVSEDAWGLADGRVVDAHGVVGRIPDRVTALEAMPGGWAVGTEQGLYLLRERMEKLTTEGQICGNFVTGAAEFQGELVVGTFEDGACRFDGTRWHRIEGLPSEMINDLAVYEGQVWFATSGGVARWDGDRVETFEVAPWTSFRRSPGTHHTSVSALAVGDRLWMTDVLGPVSVESDYWRRFRLAVFGTSYQAVAACGEEAWASSEDAGVTHWDGEDWEQFDGTNGLPDDWVMAVACNGETAWAGTYRDGLWSYNGHAWSEVALPDPWILSLGVDGDALYVGTMNGAFRVGEDTVGLAVPDPRVHQVTVGQSIYLGSEGGLAVFER